MPGAQSSTHLKPVLLVAEDDDDLRSVLVDGMGEAFEVLEAKDGQEAIEWQTKQGRTPDVVLTDLSMPRKDGFELAQALRADERTKKIPILMLTASADRDFKLKALEFGVDDYVTKPFDLTEVKLRVRNLANVRQAQLILADYAGKLETQVARRTEELRRTINELTLAYEDLTTARTETIHVLGIACEYRDDDTAAHLKRMALYTKLIAENLGMSPEDVDMLEAVAPMHDIGKIGIPDSILLKPGKLTPEEFRVMRQHPGMGARILSDVQSPLLKEAADVAMCHHEKWDGTGYPRGLRGEKIPLSGRIVALADVFDALTQKRVYKPAFSIEESMEIINNNIGVHFDPQVATAFKRGLDMAIEICNRYRD